MTRAPFTRPVRSALLAVALLGTAAGAQETPVSAPPPGDQAQTLLETMGEDLFAGDTPDVADPRILESIKKDIAGMHYGSDPRGRDKARSVFGSNPLTSSRNPLLDQDARRRWLAAAIERVGFDTVQHHLAENSAMLREGKISREDWYRHVARCTMICNPVVQGLLYEHVRQVASRPHLLLMFATNSSDLSPAQRAQLQAFIEQVPDGYRYLLIGRASRTGKLQYNRQLSALRAAAVRDALMAMGVSGERVHMIWLGYEPPQITEAIANAYGLDPSLTDLQRNQSVMAVAFPDPGTSPPTGERPNTG